MITEHLSPLSFILYPTSLKSKWMQRFWEASPDLRPQLCFTEWRCGRHGSAVLWQSGKEKQLYFEHHCHWGRRVQHGENENPVFYLPSHSREYLFLHSPTSVLATLWDWRNILCFPHQHHCQKSVLLSPLIIKIKAWSDPTNTRSQWCWTSFNRHLKVCSRWSPWWPSGCEFFNFIFCFNACALWKFIAYDVTCINYRY